MEAGGPIMVQTPEKNKEGEAEESTRSQAAMAKAG